MDYVLRSKNEQQFDQQMILVHQRIMLNMLHQNMTNWILHEKKYIVGNVNNHYYLYQFDQN